MMEITTKYNLGDEVVGIVHRSEKTPIKCEVCLGEGKIVAKGSDITVKCPECYGRGGSSKWLPTKWMIKYHSLIIEQVRVEKTIEAPNTTAKTEESYMCEETGVGSGIIHWVRNLFPDKESAQEACDERNKEDE